MRLVRLICIRTELLFWSRRLVLTPRVETPFLLIIVNSHLLTDPLNLPVWRKYMIILLVGFYSGISVLGTSGLGSVAPELYALYHNDNPKRISDLLTYPTLFMGIGNLLSMPLANAIGRRPVFLFSLLLLTVSGIWCACSKSLTSHIAGRNIFSLAAGQSEALAPLIVQEIHFLHQHGIKLSYFVGVQNTLTAALFTATTYIVPSLGLPWWYGIMTIINGFTMIMSIFFLAETRYDRPEDATGKLFQSSSLVDTNLKQRVQSI